MFEAVARAAGRAPDALARRAEESCAPIVDRFRERRADARFRNRSRPRTTPAADAPRHVVLVVVDALRADAVAPERAPFLDSLSGTDAVAPSTWTFPSVTSLATGRYPHAHGAMRRTDGFDDAVLDVTPLPPRAAPEAWTLPEALSSAGYETRGSFGMLVPFLALAGRFEAHDLREGADAGTLLASHREWLTDRLDRRTFSYIHLSDLHEPVDPPAPYWREHGVDPSIPGIRTWRYENVCHDSPTVERYRTHRRELYRAAVEYVDNRLESHLRRLRDLLGDDALVFVAGDHGEGFWERAAFGAEHFADPRPAYCVGHGGAPYEAIARVPLLWDGDGDGAEGLRNGIGDRDDPNDRDGHGGPDGPAGHDGPVSLVDVAPTVADAVGLPTPEPADGVSLLGGSPRERREDDGGPPAGRPVLVEGARYGYEKKAAYGGGWKLIVSRGDGVERWFSLPDEEPGEPPEAVRESLLERVPPWPERGDAAGTARTAVSGGVERRLDRLGYV
ncbi:sulfatase-like hydrolase/transferase [Halegenticoccus soli]|uniref:sulfatase-like hydrolase/transferase n=1 Tax=Halegenticoccus soli TaxID=1985678 RepID=UPI0013043ECC|nr:sulfatase-like hydrolase/transferase [Halegenticoccus soli]